MNKENITLKLGIHPKKIFKRTLVQGAEALQVFQTNLMPQDQK